MKHRQRITRQDVLDDVRDNPGSTVAQIMARTGGTRVSVEQHLLRARYAGQVVNRGYQGGERTGAHGYSPGLWYVAPAVGARPLVNSAFALGAAL